MKFEKYDETTHYARGEFKRSVTAIKISKWAKNSWKIIIFKDESPAGELFLETKTLKDAKETAEQYFIN